MHEVFSFIAVFSDKMIILAVANACTTLITHMIMKRILAAAMMILPLTMSAQISNDDVHKYDHVNQSLYRNEISIPGFDGYMTLKCDFHIHTVFSDGCVWPDVRVREAWQEGLDAIAITDHLEYRPFRDIVVSDNDKSYEIAKNEADRYGFIVIKGTEITRRKPLGHLNALFIKDADAMDVADPLEAVDIALAQGGYIIWNHPGWPDNKSTMYPVHEELIRAGKIHAYEVYNCMESYPLTFDWYREYGLAPMANTDIHETVAGNYADGPGWLRPMTLVFAEEKTEEGIRQALMARRTAALFHHTLVGDEKYLSGLLSSSLKVRTIGDKRIEVRNVSDIPFRMAGNDTLYVFPAGKTVVIDLPSDELVVINCFTGHGKNLKYRF